MLCVTWASFPFWSQSEDMENTTVSSLQTQRWATGKAAVRAIQDVALAQGKKAAVSKRGGTFRLLECNSVSTGCKWYVRLARLRSAAGPGDWHVTNALLDHQNCVGVSKPSRAQLVTNAVIRGSLSADTNASAKTLVTQLRHQSKVSASEHVVYRARDTVLSEMFSEDPTTIQRLPSLLAEFNKLNPGTRTDIQRDGKGRFRRAIIVLDPRWFVTGQGIYGVDAAHMKHRKYNGVQIILVGRDGNSSNQIAAVALAPVEDYDNYAWFFSHVLGNGFPLTSSPVFSDRNVGLVSVADQLKIFNMFCVRHILGEFNSDANRF